MAALPYTVSESKNNVDLLTKLPRTFDVAYKAAHHFESLDRFVNAFVHSCQNTFRLHFYPSVNQSSIKNFTGNGMTRKQKSGNLPRLRIVHGMLNLMKSNESPILIKNKES